MDFTSVVFSLNSRKFEFSLCEQIDVSFKASLFACNKGTQCLFYPYNYAHAFKFGF